MEANVDFEFVALDYLVATERRFGSMLMKSARYIAEMFSGDEEYLERLVKRVWLTWTVELGKGLAKYKKRKQEVQDSLKSLEVFPIQLMEDCEQFAKMETEFPWLAKDHVKKLSRLSIDLQTLYWLELLVTEEDMEEWTNEVEEKFLKRRKVNSYFSKRHSVRARDLKLIIRERSDRAFRMLTKERKKLSPSNLIARLGVFGQSLQEELGDPTLVRAMESLKSSSGVEDADEISDDSSMIRFNIQDFDDDEAPQKTKGAREKEEEELQAASKSSTIESPSEGRVEMKIRKKEPYGRDYDEEEMEEEWRASGAPFPSSNFEPRSYEENRSLVEELSARETTKEGADQTEEGLDGEVSQRLKRKRRRLHAVMKSKEDPLVKARRKVRVLPPTMPKDHKPQPGSVSESNSDDSQDNQERQKPVAKTRDDSGALENTSQGNIESGFTSADEVEKVLTRPVKPKAKSSAKSPAKTSAKSPAKRPEKSPKKKSKAGMSRRGKMAGLGVVYSAQEDEQLRYWLRTIGWGRWTKVLEMGDFHPTRTTTSLKDRARNLKLNLRNYTD